MQVKQTNTTAPTPAAVDVLDSEYEVRFFDRNGSLIEVPHVSQMPRAEDG
jgi:hypothetical protein